VHAGQPRDHLLGGGQVGDDIAHVGMGAVGRYGVDDGDVVSAVGQTPHHILSQGGVAAHHRDAAKRLRAPRPLRSARWPERGGELQARLDTSPGESTETVPNSGDLAGGEAVAEASRSHACERMTHNVGVRPPRPGHTGCRVMFVDAVNKPQGVGG
jgi:hypothetical protein